MVTILLTILVIVVVAWFVLWSLEHVPGLWLVLGGIVVGLLALAVVAVALAALAIFTHWWVSVAIVVPLIVGSIIRAADWDTGVDEWLKERRERRRAIKFQKIGRSLRR